ncbi:MAG: metal-dependent hydrolase [Myxococcota bacterium]
MSNLEVRRIPFDFEDVPFMWNPEQPRFSMMMNQLTFVTIGFERYICKAIRAAETEISDPEVATEARLFREQEAVHAVAHTKHVKGLVAQYPGLQSSLDKVVKFYDDLFEEHPLEFHLAYVGGTEAIFTPFFKMILDNRATLFAGGDERVSSLFMWHFCEEVEHRSSAITIYNHVVGKYWYRLTNTRKFLGLSGSLFELMAEEFKKHVPNIPEAAFEGSPFDSVPRIDKLRSSMGILGAQVPWHKPVNQAVPDYYAEWMAHWNAGEDVTRLYGQPAQELKKVS